MSRMMVEQLKEESCAGSAKSRQERCSGIVAEAILIVVTMSFRPSDVLGRQFNAPLLVAGGGAGASLVVVGNAIP